MTNAKTSGNIEQLTHNVDQLTRSLQNLTDETSRLRSHIGTTAGAKTGAGPTDTSDFSRQLRNVSSSLAALGAKQVCMAGGWFHDCGQL